MIEVTNLNDSGAGSLRACVDATGPRICVFRVGGTINLQSAIRVVNPYITIAGQTAPGQGIQLKNHSFLVVGTHDVIIRYIRSRPGYDGMTIDPTNGRGSQTNALSVIGGGATKPTYNVIVDHSVAMWSTDQNMDAYGHVYDVTLQWNIIAEGLNYGHDTDGKTTGHSMASLIGSEPAPPRPMTVSYHHNLVAQNGDRGPAINPYLLDSAGMAAIPAARVDIRNNVIYNWKGDGGITKMTGSFYSNTGWNSFKTQSAGKPGVEVNLVGNHWIEGPDVNPGSGVGWVTDFVKVHAAQNLYAPRPNTSYGPGCPTTPCDGFAIRINRSDNNANGIQDLWAKYPNYDTTAYSASTPFNFPPVTTTPATQVLNLVLDNAGASKVKRDGVVVSIRDSVDARIAQEVRDRTGRVGGVTYSGCCAKPTYPTIAGGTAPTDIDRDGMPDSWETARGLNPNSASDGPLTASNGYTNVENYLNELAGDFLDGSLPAPPPPPPAAPVSVAFSSPTAGQVFVASGTVASGAPRVEGTVIIKAPNAVKVELSRDAPSADCPSCGTPFRTWTAPTSGTDTFSTVMCVNCFNSAETLPRQMTLHAVAYDSAGGKKQADVTVTVTNQAPPPLSLAIETPAAGQVFPAAGLVVNGAPRVETQVRIKAPGAVKVELSRDAPSADCPSCGTPFFTSTAPAISPDIHLKTMCVNCFGAAETLPRQTTLHAKVYDSAGNVRQADVTVLVTNQSGPATDLNGDGRTDVADVQLAVNQVLVPGVCGSGDVNRDGSCNVADVQMVVNKSLGI